MKALKIIFIILAVILVILVLLLGYLGFMPFVSHLFGSDKPKDLGVKYSQEDLNSQDSKSGVKQEELPSSTTVEKSMQFSGSKPIKDSFTGEELTAKVNDNSSKWGFYPVSRVQIKFNSDGTGEISGILDIGKLYTWATSFGIPASDIDWGRNKLKFIMTNPTFYFKASGTAANNNLNTELISASIGKLPIPVSWFSPYQDKINGYVNSKVHNVSGFSIKSGDITGGKLNVDLNFPATVKYIGK